VYFLTVLDQHMLISQIIQFWNSYSKWH